MLLKFAVFENDFIKEKEMVFRLTFHFNMTRLKCFPLWLRNRLKKRQFTTNNKIKNLH